MKLSKMFAVLAAAGLTVGMGSAQASISFLFNPNGTGVGGAVSAGILDQAPGSTLALNAVNGGLGLAKGTVITDYYQANLSSVQALSTLPVFSNGTGGKFFTFAATFTEVVTASFTDPGVVTVNSFSITGGTFKMCAQSVLGDNLLGTGFSCAGNGILSGTITGGTATQTGYLNQPLVNLDNAGTTNDWPGVQTVQSDGTARLQATITYADAGYFPDLSVNTQIVLSAINSSLVTPFSQVDPSRKFSSDTVADGNVTPNIGTINGLNGRDFIFQSDANASFEATPRVPEPGSLALVGLALASVSLIRRRKA
jgi:hypothetical protein